MNVPAPHGLALVLVCGALVAAVSSDLRARRIPNALTAAMAIAGLANAVISGGALAALGSLLGAALGVALLAWPFARGFIGGGDVKLLAALGCWVGPLGTVWVLLVGSVLGGVLGVIYFLRLAQKRRADAREVRDNLAVFARGGGLHVPPPARLGPSRGVPYGLAFALAGGWLLLAGVVR